MLDIQRQILKAAHDYGYAQAAIDVFSQRHPSPRRGEIKEQYGKLVAAREKALDSFKVLSRKLIEEGVYE